MEHGRVKVGLLATGIRAGVSGGLEAYALNLATALARTNGLEITLFAAPLLREGLRSLAEEGEVEFAEIEAARGSRLRRVAWEQTALREEIRRRRLDLLHSLTYVSPIGVEVPRVATIADLLVYRYPEYVPPIKRLYWNAAIPATIAKAQAVVAISEFTRREICEFFPGACRKTFVTPLALDRRFERVELQKSEDNEESEARIRSLRQPFVLTVGGLGKHKNTELAVNAIRLSKDIWGQHRSPQLVIVGRDYGAAGALRTLMRRLCLDESDVLLTGRVDFRKLRYLYRSAVALLAISRYEGFGLPALEALRFGTPVIGLEGGAIGEVVGDGGILISRADPSRLAGAIQEACHRKEQMAELRTRGRRRASVFTWARTAAATLAAYEHALATPPRRA